MTARQKFIDLLVRLKVETSRGKVNWHETANEDTFRTSLGESMVRVSCHTSDDFERRIYHATLLNGKAKVVDVVGSLDDPAFEVIEELFHEARRSARKADEVLDSALSFINDQSNG